MKIRDLISIVDNINKLASELNHTGLFWDVIYGCQRTTRDRLTTDIDTIRLETAKKIQRVYK